MRYKESSVDQGQEVKNPIFQQNIRNYFMQKTKCELVEIFSEMFGLKPSMVFYLMNDDNFGLEKELVQYAETVEIPSWPLDHVTAAEEYLDILFTDVSDVVSNAEKYMAVGCFLSIVFLLAVILIYG